MVPTPELNADFDVKQKKIGLGFAQFALVVAWACRTGGSGASHKKRQKP